MHSKGKLKLHAGRWFIWRSSRVEEEIQAEEELIWFANPVGQENIPNK